MLKSSLYSSKSLNQHSISMKWIRAFGVFLGVVIMMAYEEAHGSLPRRVAMAAMTDPVELQAVYAMMAATGNTWAASIPDVCVKSGRWHGIECAQDGDSFHVVGLSFGLITDQATTFPSCEPNSTISPAVANLTHLRKLRYFTCCNENPQPIPREIGRLGATLETLQLRSNGHVGILTPELANLTKLRTFDVHGNSLTGGLPVWFSSLTELQTIDVSDNKFQDEVNAHTIDNLERLKIFDASANHLVGAIPDSIGRLRTLKKLDLSYNNFTGAIPASLGYLGSLLALNLAHNAFTGPMPETLGGLSALKSMDLQGNRFQAPIPTSFGKLRNLEGLVLSEAQFSGSIPSSLGSLTNLRALYLDGNKLTGPIPPALGGLTRMNEMELSSNLLAGPVPFSASFVSRLGRRLRLQNNEGLCYEFEAAKSLTNAQGATVRPTAQSPKLKICSSSIANSQNITSLDYSPPALLAPVPSTASWNPAFALSSSCSPTSALQAAKCSMFMVLLLTI